MSTAIRTISMRSLLLASLAFSAALVPLAAGPYAGHEQAATSARSEDNAAATAVRASHRLIVELKSPSLAASPLIQLRAVRSAADGLLDVDAPVAQSYIRSLMREQRAFIERMTQAVPGATVTTFRDEYARQRQATSQIVLNSIAVDPGRHADVERVRQTLLGLPGVKAVYRDYAHHTDLYASLPLINATATWNLPAIGGVENAGRGIRLASMDAGVHKDAPMFDGTGYVYPNGFPKGYVDNTNGKIIASRAYFRTWDPPAEGEGHPWPGPTGDSHGVHTASTAAGNRVVAEYYAITETLSGVAPAAYVMSYKVFYDSITGDQSFYTVEGIAALEDIVRDGAHVVNNSWGGGPGSLGGEHDPLDFALVNAVKAGVFVSMSNGNAGPGPGTGDHPSAEYINVAASSTSGTYAAGNVNVTAPEPVPDELRDLAMAEASFGALLPTGVSGPYNYVSAVSIDPANERGCTAWPENALAGKTVIISRGACEFGVKVLNAERAGAEFVVVHNDAARGDQILSMGPGAVGNQVTIPSIFVGYSSGRKLVDLYAQHGEKAAFEVDLTAYQLGSVPDRVIGFSSRGPGVGNNLKPDIAAPGVNILAQGYGRERGETAHLGYGQASGTSMAAPHVAGAAALVKQVHPDWSPAWIKSALMSTSAYTNIFNFDESPAQPLDIGAGRLDLAQVTDPGVILSPPSLSFGQVVTGTTARLDVTLTSVAERSETYALSTLYTGAGFLITQTMPVAGLTVSPRSVRLAPGQSATISLEWDTTLSMGYGDNQGYVVLTGQGHDAHLPAWIRVGYDDHAADVLIIDNDGSARSPELTDYTPAYAEALDELATTHEVWDVDARHAAGMTGLSTLPHPSYLERFGAVIYQTGDNFAPGGGYGVGAPPPTRVDLNQLMEYLNAGGRLLGFGQDLSSVFAGSFVYQVGFGAEPLLDSVSSDEVFTDRPQLLSGLSDSPFAGLDLDISATGDGAGNLSSVDEIKRQDPEPDTPDGWTDEARPTFRYAAGGQFAENGYVGLSRRDQPTLERTGITFAGRTLYFAFGLEGINDDTGFTTRSELLGRALEWIWDDASVSITSTVMPANNMTVFSAALTSTQGYDGVAFRWDFGDGSPLTRVYSSGEAGHIYRRPGTYTVRVEASNELGTRAVGQIPITVVGEREYHDSGVFKAYLPHLDKSRPAR